MKMFILILLFDFLREIDVIILFFVILFCKVWLYVMFIVGVNGVGKLINFFKICFFLLQNKYKVFIVVGDMFCFGVVEQFVVYVCNLKELIVCEGG